MTARGAAPFDSEDEQPSKRRRETQDEEDTVVVADAAPPCLDSVNDDCLVLILSHLPANDLNTVALVNERFREARNHESLDQTRTGTIMISQGSTFETIFMRIVNNEWNGILERNHYTHLKIVGLDQLVESPNARRNWSEMVRASQLTAITSLDVSCNHSTNRQDMDELIIRPLTYIFPNLMEVDLSYLMVQDPGFICSELCSRCPNLQKLTWKGRCGDGQYLDSSQFRDSVGPIEVYLDDCHFHTAAWTMEDVIRRYTDIEEDDFMFRRSPSLERLSMKNATFDNWAINATARPVSQDMLIKMVRLHPTLRWLRSDLTEENVAMLKRERPHITFVH